MKLDDKSDVDLVRLFQSGDPLAFDAIVRRFQDRVYRLALVCLRDSQQAADAAQEVFVRGFTGLRGFRFRSVPYTWLYRTTRNVCRELNRRHATETLVNDVPDSQSPAERLYADHESALRVRKVVAGLPERQRDVVLLRIFEDLSVRDTAKAMGCREGTVKALLHKAIRNLKLSMPSNGNDHER